jgi:uncharacterized membrane protein YhfC
VVRASSIIFLSISLLLSVVFPVVTAVVLHRKLRFAWRSVLAGALVFLVFQILTRIPLLGYLNGTAWYRAFSAGYPAGAALLLALSAGLFEETGRYVGFRLVLRKYQGWPDGIAYGIGHGGFESISLIGITLLSDLIVAVLINSGRAPAQLSESTISALVNVVPSTFLIIGVERVLAFAIQIGLSLVILYGIRAWKPAFFFLAIALHTLLDFGGILLSGNLLAAETFIAIVAIASLVWIFKSKKLFERHNTPVAQQS